MDRSYNTCLNSRRTFGHSGRKQDAVIEFHIRRIFQPRATEYPSARQHLDCSLFSVSQERKAVLISGTFVYSNGAAPIYKAVGNYPFAKISAHT